MSNGSKIMMANKLSRSKGRESHPKLEEIKMDKQDTR
jgi:hypothetical protein